MTIEQAYRPPRQWADPVFEHQRVECSDCGALLQECPSWAEKPGQDVYRCPWATREHIRVEHNEPSLLIYNCNWPKGAIARRIGDQIR